MMTKKPSTVADILNNQVQKHENHEEKKAKVQECLREIIELNRKIQAL